MAASNQPSVLSDDDLNDWDHHILTQLQTHGNLTPGAVRKLLEESDTDPPVRQYINDRMRRLAEHNHLENIVNSGVYKLVDDPREN
jgi:hypothetical protein